MNFFEATSLRLKQQLKVTEDKLVADIFGMTIHAWSKRKTRNSFPEKELRALAQSRPDLKIDVNYVLTGTPQIEYSGAQLLTKAYIDAFNKVAAYFDWNDTFISSLIDNARMGDKKWEESLKEALLRAKPPFEQLSEQENLLIAHYREADAAGKAAIDITCASLAQAKKARSEKPKSTKKKA